MTTLLLQCVGPLQSWGTQSDFTVRDTGRDPSKSGIVGLLCAALGRPRTEQVADLAALKMGVRVDQEGKILRDYHTAGKDGYLGASGKPVRRRVITSERYYLSDAAFLVALQGKTEILKTIHTALANPRWMLYLGRKACPSSEPIFIPADKWDWTAEMDELFKTYPWLGRNENQYEKLDRVRVVMDYDGIPTDDQAIQLRQDHPISFEKGNRKFIPRRVTTTFINKPPFSKDLAGLEIEEVS